MKKIMLNVLVVLMAFMSIITPNVVFAETITLSSSIVNKENGGTVLDGTQQEQTITHTLNYDGCLTNNQKYYVKLNVKDVETGANILDSDGMPVELLFEFNPTEETGVLVNDITFETLGYGGREIYVETSWYENNMNNLFCSCESSSLEISQYLQSTITVKCGEVEIPNTEITIYNNGVVAKDINGNDCIGVTNSLVQIEFIFRIW